MVKGLWSTVLCLSACITFCGEHYIVNEVVAVISGNTRTALILKSDIRPALDGRERTLRDLVLEELMLFDAERLNMTASEDDVDRYLKQLQKSYSKKQIEESLQAIGFTMDDAREQLRRQEIISKLFDYRVRGDKRLVTNHGDVEEEWKKIAPVEEATVSLADAIIKTKETQKELQKRIDSNTLGDNIVWDSPFKIAESELAADKRFVMNRTCGDIIFINPVEGGFQITKVAEKSPSRVMPLITGNKEEDDRRIAAIEEQIRVQRFNRVKADYEQSLLSKARIKFTYESDRRAVYGE